MLPSLSDTTLSLCHIRGNVTCFSVAIVVRVPFGRQGWCKVGDRERGALRGRALRAGTRRIGLLQLGRGVWRAFHGLSLVVDPLDIGRGEVTYVAYHAQAKSNRCCEYYLKHLYHRTPRTTTRHRSSAQPESLPRLERTAHRRLAPQRRREHEQRTCPSKAALRELEGESDTISRQTTSHCYTQMR